jgi:hypothetical protein
MELYKTPFRSDLPKMEMLGAKNIPSSSMSGPGRDNSMVVAAFCALNQKAPPLIIF